MDSGLPLLPMSPNSRPVATGGSGMRWLGCSILVALLSSQGALVGGCSVTSHPYSKDVCLGNGAEERLWELGEQPSEWGSLLQLVEGCAAQGFVEYQLLLSALMLNDVEVAESDRIFARKPTRSEALRWLARAAEQKDDLALGQWADVFESGSLGLTRDTEVAQACLNAEIPKNFRYCLERIGKALEHLESLEKTLPASR